MADEKTEVNEAPNLDDLLSGDANEMPMTDQDKESQQAMFERKKAIEAEEADLANRERLAAVKRQQLEVDEREDAMKEQDEVIENYQTGKTAKPGQPFIDSQQRQHAGNCNSHPSKRKQFKCDCGKNGTPRYRNWQ
jgi:hypothetical protein